MDRYQAMKIFVRVAELGSFTKASEEFNIPKASASHAVKDLENQLGIKLMTRTTRQVLLTPDGKSYLDRAKNLLLDLEETENMFRQDSKDLRGKIRVDMATRMASGTFLPRLSQFLKDYPNLEIELSSTDRHIDLVRDGVDCLIRSGNYSHPGTIERVLGNSPMINCVSPAYIKKYGTPKTLQDLKKHKLVFYAQNLGQRTYGFEYFDGEKYQEISMKGDVTVNNTETYHTACLQGFGIIQSPLYGMKDYLKKGQLVEILPKYKAEPLVIKLVYVERRLISKRVRVFMDWLEQEIKKVLNDE